MGIQDNIEAMCTQKAVYWGNPINDGEGGFTFDDPVEIDCRWEDMKQVVMDAKGHEFTSRAVVYVVQDLDEEGKLWLGSLEELYDESYASDSSAGAVDDPMTIPKAYYIRRFQKDPSLDGEGYIRKAFLTPTLSFGGQ
jgi:hypothetical protein